MSLNPNLAHHVISEGTVLDAMTATSGWTASGSGTVAAATAPDGSACLRHTTAVGTDSDLVKSLPHSLSDGLMSIDAWCVTGESSVAGSARLKPFHMDAGVTNYLDGEFHRIPNGCWHRIYFRRALRRDGGAGAVADTGVTVFGTGNPHQTFSAVWLRTRAVSGVAVQVLYKNLRVGVKTKPANVIRIDDAHESVPSFQAILDDLGLKATLFVIPGLIGTAGYMTSAQLDTWIDAGHEIANHTWSHQENVLPSASVATCYDEIQRAADWMIARYGANHPNVFPRIFANPFGERGTNYDAALIQADIQMSLSTIQVCAPWSLVGNRLSYPTYIINGTTSTVETDMATMSGVHAQGGIFIMGLHRYVAGSPSINTELGDVRARQMLGRMANEQESIPVLRLGRDIYPFIAGT